MGVKAAAIGCRPCLNWFLDDPILTLGLMPQVHTWALIKGMEIS